MSVVTLRSDRVVLEHLPLHQPQLLLPPSLPHAPSSWTVEAEGSLTCSKDRVNFILFQRCGSGDPALCFRL
ncbi:unnamed protein product [Clavelina lepadiformis]|uniref:Uncharacterized protein n=1 Tax=Clavelina lepadiformis TaxID=159417 RepID=A0ABP0GEW4_CLALP